MIKLIKLQRNKDTRVTEDAELGKSDPQTTRHIPQDTCTSMLLLGLKLMLELCATSIFLLQFQTNKTIALKVCQATQMSVSSAFSFVESLSSSCSAL